MAPFRAMGGSLETTIPMVVVIALAILLGIALVGSRTAEVRTRKIGAAVLAAGGAAILLFGAAGAAGELGEIRHWLAAVLDQVKPLPGRFPRSGALAIVSIGLMLGAVFTLRAGIARTQAFYSKKK